MSDQRFQIDQAASDQINSHRVDASSIAEGSFVVQLPIQARSVNEASGIQTDAHFETIVETGIVI